MTPAQRLWFPAIEAFLFRPRRLWRSTLRLPSGLNSHAPRLSLHYRAGDTVNLSWRKRAPAREYVSEALAMKGNISSADALIFLATDSVTVKQELVQMSMDGVTFAASDVSVVHVLSPTNEKMDATMHIESWIAGLIREVGTALPGASVDKANLTRQFDNHHGLRIRNLLWDTVTMPAVDLHANYTDGQVASLNGGVIADIWELAQGRALIGTCLSQVSRTAYELIYARGAAQLPPIGIDAVECANFAAPHPYTIPHRWILSTRCLTPGGC